MESSSAQFGRHPTRRAGLRLLPAGWLMGICAMAGAAQAPQLTPELDVLNRVRQRMAQNLEHLPDYTCLETIERSILRLPQPGPVFNDKIRVEVAYIGGKELFSWPGSAKFEYSNPGDMVSGGASDFGSFGAFVDTIFRSSAPVFSYGGLRSIEGRSTLQFNFRVPLSRSGFRVKIKDREATVPYSGAVWIDPAVLSVVRLEIRAEKSELPVASISNVVDYAPVRIGGGEFLLPGSSELIIVDLENEVHRNRSRFTGCRQYSVESSISFDATAETAPASDPRTLAPALPAGITLDVKLESPISFEQSAVGDPVTARLDRAVNSGGVRLPKGATIFGRIRQLEQYYAPAPYFIVGLEFSSIAFERRTAVFRARLVGPALKMRERRESPMYGTSPRSMGVQSSGLDIDVSESPPGSGAFRIWSKSLRLKRGLRMIWETEEGKKPAPGAAAAAPVSSSASSASAPAAPAVERPAPAPAVRTAKVPLPTPVQTAPAPPVIRTTSRLVEVHVVAHDLRGKPVRDLTRNDLVLLDEGQPQKISSFSLETVRSSPAPPAPLPPNLFSNSIGHNSNGPITATVVLFDRLNTRSENQNYAERELLKFLKKTRSLERVAIYVLDSRLRMLVDFTSDKDLLARSLRSVSGGTSSQLDASEPAKPEVMTDRFKWVQREIGRTDRIVATLATEARAENTLRALEAIGHNLSGVPGRKSLVWISDAFPLTMGVEVADLLASAGRGENRGLPAMNLAPQIARTARVLTDANVAVYPVEARGLTGVAGADAAASAPTGPEIHAPGQKEGSTDAMREKTLEAVEGDTSLPRSVLGAWRTMEALAQDTGGRAFRGSNDIGEGIRQALHDADSVYLLAYSPAHNEWNGKFRHIEVRGKREELKLRYRSGYFAAPAEMETGEPLERMLLAASASPLDATGIDLTAGLTRPSPPESRQWKVSLTVDARNISLEATEERRRGSLDLLFVQRAADGTELSVIKSELPIFWDQQAYESHVAEGIRLTKLLDLVPGATRLRIVVRDRRSGKIGSLNIPL